MKRSSWLINCTTALAATLFLSHAVAESRHHALIIGVGQYTQASGADPLLGVPKDMETARKMAQAMGVSDDRIMELRDDQATKPNILAALEKIRSNIRVGERAFIYYSGHGTSVTYPKGCEEGLIPYTQGAYRVEDLLTESELATYTHKISEKADKAIVLIDACFSGGVVAGKTRSLSAVDEIRAKFSQPRAGACDVPVNYRKTRSFTPALQRLGTPEQNFVQISAANYNEVSWDSPKLGGLATHSLGECLLGQAKDADRSGAITLEEVRQCAQAKVNQLIAPYEAQGKLPATIQIRGTRNLIVVADPPQVVALRPEPPKPPVQQTPPPASPTQTTSPQIPQKEHPPPAPTAPPTTPQTPAVATTTEAIKESPVEQQVASMATLQDILAQRNGRLNVEVKAPKQLAIGKDRFSFNVKANTDGYLYAVMLGSDGQSFYLLFPNKIDTDNKIKANTSYQFPRKGWSIKAGGPEGTNKLLLVVSQSPRDPKLFVPDGSSGGGPFTYAVSDLTARKRLIDFFVGRGVQGNARMAAGMVEIREVP
jgi:hypothetical protein